MPCFENPVTLGWKTNKGAGSGSIQALSFKNVMKGKKEKKNIPEEVRTWRAFLRSQIVVNFEEL